MYVGETGNNKFCLENVKGRDHLGYLNVAEMIIIKIYVKEIGCEDMNWIELT
jgi:hypothetical protein